MAELAVVTGASGLLGGNLAAELSAQGIAVRATRRAGSRVAQLAHVPISWVDAELTDVPSLARAFAGADVVFHCAAAVSIRRKPTPALVAANVDGTRNVLEAVRASGAKRLVHCSTVAALGVSEDGRPCAEGTPWNVAERGLDDGYCTTKRAAQDLVEAAARGGLDAVIVNPTYMFGPLDAKPSSGTLLIAVARRRVPGWTPGFNNFVDVRDVARGMILAWRRGRAGERYILGGHNLSYRDIFERIAREADVPAISKPASRWLASLLGRLGDVQESLTTGDPLVTTMRVRWAFEQGFQFSSDKARRELGYAPGPIEPAIRDALAWFGAQGMLGNRPRRGA